jgi:hypothetical protein
MMALKKRHEHQLDTCGVFIEPLKAYDRVPRDELFMVHEKFGIPPKKLTNHPFSF